MIVVPVGNPDLGAAARLADGVRGVEPIVPGEGMKPFQDARRPGADAGQEHHGRCVLGAGYQDMGVAETGFHHPAISFDGETGQLFLIEGYDFSFAPGTFINGCGGHMVY